MHPGEGTLTGEYRLAVPPSSPQEQEASLGEATKPLRAIIFEPESEERDVLALKIWWWYSSKPCFMSYVFSRNRVSIFLIFSLNCFNKPCFHGEKKSVFLCELYLEEEV